MAVTSKNQNPDDQMFDKICNRLKRKKQTKNESKEQNVNKKSQEVTDSISKMSKMSEIQKVCDNTPDFDSIFEKHRLPCMTIDVNESLSETSINIQRQIVKNKNRKPEIVRFRVQQ